MSKSWLSPKICLLEKLTWPCKARLQGHAHRKNVERRYNKRTNQRKEITTLSKQLYHATPPLWIRIVHQLSGSKDRRYATPIWGTQKFSFDTSLALSQANAEPGETFSFSLQSSAQSPAIALSSTCSLTPSDPLLMHPSSADWHKRAMSTGEGYSSRPRPSNSTTPTFLQNGAQTLPHTLVFGKKKGKKAENKHHTSHYPSTCESMAIIYHSSPQHRWMFTFLYCLAALASFKVIQNTPIAHAHRTPAPPKEPRPLQKILLTNAERKLVWRMTQRNKRKCPKYRWSWFVHPQPVL